jgi:hypothetical protein
MATCRMTAVCLIRGETLAKGYKYEPVGTNACG